ncbi:MAG: MBOAT family protein [Oscillospiraceae bacterium]|nr:MBOAT family protein [Lachnospiraceae bacterium]MBR0160411.1 MBOAT family protein [Oscillospiraceae bacterium]
MVVFSGLGFLFRFLPVFLLAYYLTPARHRYVTLFLGSVVFYASGDFQLVWLLLALVVVNFLLAGFGKTGQILMIILNVGALAIAKVCALFWAGAYLPLGMSFYIFKMISFQADLMTGRITKRPSFFQTAAYFTMFPQVTQGPIMRYTEGAFSAERRVQISDVDEGLTLLCMGMVLKVLLADRIGILWNEIVKIGFESVSTPLAWLGAFGYSFQLYFDFWGYSLMAAGLAMMLGFPFILNFEHPYSADGIADFYRRWHMTLGQFFRDYVYIPLGGSREGSGRTIWNLFIVWALTGIWHGGTLNFVLWGMVLFLLIVYEKYVAAGWMERFKWLGHVHVWIFIPLTWVIFAISDLGDLGIYFARLFPFFGIGAAVNPEDIVKYGSIYWPYLAVAVTLCIPRVGGALLRFRKRLWMKLILIALFWVAVYYAAISGSNAFMYFSF